MATKIKIGSIDCVPEHDPYHRGQCEPTATVLNILPENDPPLVTVGQEMDQGATDAMVWHGRIITCGLGHDDEYITLPDEDALTAYLNSDPAQALLGTIVREYDYEWDGHNFKGQRNAALNTALAKLLDQIADLPAHEWLLTSISDWMQHIDINDYITDSIDRTVSDRVLEARARDLEADVDERAYKIAFDETFLDYLTRERDQLRADRAED